MKPLLVIMLTSLVSAKNLQQKFIKEPVSVRVREGATVSLECRVAGMGGVLQWTKDGFGLGTSRELPGYTRLAMTGGNNETWDLEIQDVRLEDDGVYQCQVGATETLGPIRSENAVISVLKEPEPPVLTVSEVMRLEEDKVGLVQCVSRGGHPASMIRWRINGELVSSGITENVTKMRDAKRTVTTSTLKFPASVNLSGSELSCEAENEANTGPHIVKTRLQVEYKPRVALQVNKDSPTEGESITAVCNVDALPQQVSYQWFLDDQEIKEALGAVELVLDVTRDLHDKTISCLARNSLGQTAAQHKLDVKYGPEPVEAEVSEVTGARGDRVILHCQVDSNPAPEYRWLRNGDMFELVGTGPVLSFSLSPATEGVYTCQASVTGYQPLNRKTQVTLLGPPVILQTEEAQLGSLGDTVMVHCLTQSSPDLTTILWSFGGEEVRRQGGGDISIVESRTGNRIKSTVVIKNAQKKHFGQYLCAVENELGRAEVAIKLEEIEPLPLLIILAATISGVLLSIVILVIAMTCVKTAAKRSQSRADRGESPDLSAWPRGSSCSSSSDSDTDPSQSNITSSLTVDDPDDSFESLPVNYSAFIKSENIPDPKNCYQQSSDPVINDKETSILVRDGMRQSCNYIVYNHYSSDQELQQAGPAYANPYVQSTSPMTVAQGPDSRTATASPFYTNITPYRERDSAVIRYLEGEVSAQELDDIKLGTHV